MKVFLSPPVMNDDVERRLVAEAFDSGYIAPCGPMVDLLEKEAADCFGFRKTLATASGTLALDLLARALEIRTGDKIIVSDLTFIGSLGAFVTMGAEPVFVDSDPQTWCMDPQLLEVALQRYPQAKAVIVTDLYGQSCDIDALASVCKTYGTKLIVDAAESVGATYRGRASGKGAWAAIYSFNGNKIITTGGGGMLLSDDEALVALCRKLSAQAREAYPWYEHCRVGTQGRMSNIAAAIGVGQLRHLTDALRDKAAVWAAWQARLADRPWAAMMPTAAYGVPNRWLTVVTLQGIDPVKAVEALAAAGIEARPLWKPMHLQPVFQTCDAVLSGISDELFRCGLCLPSGRNLRPETMDEILQIMDSLC
ncbi:MAG: aminotransferase class I/II-fold pyridoxal phosphate-dependent enzyme [Kiritimatiellae bacterium]|nr:aminotransferase class I/II-fold pyridoxal phosphate-dependent enzyme [Kiritimatiellia bacterium]